MSWPTEQEVADKLIEMAYVWRDIEEKIAYEAQVAERYVGRSFDADDVDEPFLEYVQNQLDWANLGVALARAFRIEATIEDNGSGDACSTYTVLFDVADADARQSVYPVEDSHQLRDLIREKARPWHTGDFLIVKAVPRGTPVNGQICTRRGEEHPVQVTPSLDDVPTFKPSAGTIELTERWPYWLTPIEVPFYEALCETGLTFSAQPWIQTADEKYRVDFVVFYGGGMWVVELDGHDFHKTKEQRGKDYEKERALLKRGFGIVRFTGSDVYADVEGCIRELKDVVRQGEARP